MGNTLLLFSIFSIPSLSFIIGIDYLLSSKKKTNIGLIFLPIVFLIGYAGALGIRIIDDNPQAEISLLSNLIDFCNWYIGWLALYAILNIPYLIYLFIKKKEGKKRTIIKIIGLLIICFILVMLVNLNFSY